MIVLHRHYTLLAKPLKRKLIYILRVFILYHDDITRIVSGNDFPSDVEMSVIINPFNGIRTIFRP